jgi:glycosyltransferase involved in cell wall biosynthesis
VGRIKRYKRLDLLVGAMAALRERFPDVHLDIAGDGDALPTIREMVAEQGLEGCVTVHGRVTEERKAEILRTATVFATPSMHEGWGLAVIEANVWGCPAVAYDVPGLRVAIRDGETGLLAQDDAGFVEALATLLADHAQRDRMAANARSWATTFDWRNTANATLRVMESCNGRHPEYLSV